MRAFASLMSQFPLAEKRTGRPEVAVAATAKSGSPNVAASSGPKTIDWLAFAIARLRVTIAAASRFASPGRVAVTAHDPAPVMWTVEPLTAQLPVPEKATG